MEFVVAILSAAVSSAIPKLTSVIANLVGEAKADATFIKDELLMIQETIRRHPFNGTESIAQLRRLAYDIEDCIDCFQVKKTSSKEFAEEIARLKTRSLETRTRIKEYNSINGGFKEGQEQIAPAAPPKFLVPHELQQHLGQQSEDWVDKLNCLLYFCMFPGDHHARRNPLIRRWLAEELMGGDQAKAKKYLEDLIDGNIINTTAKSNNGMMKRCQPSGGIHRFIRQQSHSTNFMLFCEDMTNLEADCARRLSLHPKEDIPEDMNFPRLHTLAVFHRTANPDSYDAILRSGKYEVLRVLDLKECVPMSEEHLLAISNLLLLKYLSFQGGSDRLPRKIGKLAWLETLDMRGSKTVTVYKEVLMMRRLKHLLGKFQLSKTDTFLWTVCNLQTTDLGKFLEQKSVLETLSGFVTGDRSGFPQLMILMRKLRKVKIWCKQNASEDNLQDISSAITKFVADGIQGPGRSMSIDFQEYSGQFFNNIQVKRGSGLSSLKLHGNLKNEFPKFVAQLSAVEDLCLSSTALSWNVILDGLSNLNILKYLKLVEPEYKLGHVEILPKHLRSLQRLCLVCVPNLNITIQAGALPGLVSLQLVCQYLDAVPGTSQMEITHMTDLQEVGLHSQLDQAIKQVWAKAAEAHPNTPRVFDVQSPNVGTTILR